MDEDGFYCCSDGDCFEKYMDETYGKHKWMEINDDGENGYYIYADDTVVGGYRGTGIFYTEWTDDDEWVKEVEKLEAEGVLFVDGHVDMERFEITQDDFEMMRAGLV